MCISRIGGLGRAHWGLTRAAEVVIAIDTYGGDPRYRCRLIGTDELAGCSESLRLGAGAVEANRSTCDPSCGRMRLSRGKFRVEEINLLRTCARYPGHSGLVLRER